MFILIKTRLVSGDYSTHSSATTYLREVRRHREIYIHNLLGVDLTIFPDVMSPKYDPSTKFHIENMPNQNGKDFLDVGCGSGAIGLFAGLQGATRITAVDINPKAISCTRANLFKHKIKNYEVFESNVFSNVRGKYDTINFAAPYHGSKPSDFLEYGVSDPNYTALRSFLKNAKHHLKDNGKILLGFSNTGDVNLLHKLIDSNKLKIVERKEREQGGWVSYLYVIEPMK